VREAARTKKHVAFVYLDDLAPLILGFDMKLDGAVNLLKKLLTRFHVKIEAGVGAMQDHDDEFIVVDQYPIGPEWWIEKVLVLLHPLFQMKS
jgi:hypothetical protein